MSTRRCTSVPSRTRRATGPSAPRTRWPGRRSGTRSSSGASTPSPASSGSRAASSTRATTASTATSRRARATSPPSSSRATRATRKTYTYKQLLDEVSKFANVLKKHGVKKGDRVAIYLPMIAELPVVMLACARIGAIHMIVFGGFSRRGAQGPHRQLRRQGAHLRRQGLPRLQDDRLQDQRRRRHQRRDDGREGHRRQARRRRRADDRGPRRLVPRGDGAPPDITADCPPVPVDAEHPLFILYTVGLDGHAEGRPAHHRRLPALRARHGQVRVRPARRRRPLLHGRHRLDHRPQLHRLRPARCGVTSILFEGLPTYPEPDRYWQVVEKHKATTDLHRADRHPQPHRPGRRVGRQARHADAARDGLGRRADQRQQLALVLREGRQEPQPAGRHVVADRDRRPHDRAAPGRHAAQAGLGRPAVLRRADRRAASDDGSAAGVGEDGHLCITPRGPA